MFQREKPYLNKRFAILIVFTSSTNIPDKKDDLSKTFLDQHVLKDLDLRKIF